MKAAPRVGFEPERYTSIGGHEREGKPGGRAISTAERNGLMAMMVRLDAAEFETRAIGQLAASDCGETGRLHALRYQRDF